jgi:hypothetical protein
MLSWLRKSSDNRVRVTKPDWLLRREAGRPDWSEEKMAELQEAAKRPRWAAGIETGYSERRRLERML